MVLGPSMGVSAPGTSTITVSFMTTPGAAAPPPQAAKAHAAWLSGQWNILASKRAALSMASYQLLSAPVRAPAILIMKNPYPQMAHIVPMSFGRFLVLFLRNRRNLRMN
ncbi:MAG: hypothetical protein MUO77_05010 [Anaerolineales bacterium]|nr:hypothetical protein [Anaerolineales bacterium]